MEDFVDKKSVKSKMRATVEDEEVSDDSLVDSEDDDETIARIQRAHFAQAAAMSSRRRSAPRARPMSAKRKMEAVKDFHDFTKKLKKEAGITIRGLVGNNILELSDFSSEDSKSDSDGLSEEEFVVNPTAVQELNEENESYIDPETGDIVEAKKEGQKSVRSLSPSPKPEPEAEPSEAPKTLSISDIINDGDLDLSKNVEIAEVDEGELCTEKTAEELLDIKQEENSQDFDIAEKLKEMDEISVKPVKKEDEEGEDSKDEEKKTDSEQEKKGSTNALNVRRNIREVMDEKNLDASTLTAQRQESERLARVQEQQRIIREVQRQIALNRQNKIHQKTLSLLQGGSSILKQSSNKLNLPNTVLVKLPSGETKRTTLKQGQVEVTKIPKPTPSGSAPKSEKPDQKTDKKEVVEIVSSSSGDESSSSTSDSDDCIMLSDSEVPPSPEAEDDPNNSGLHVNDAYNIPDEQGRVLINIGHPESEEDIFLAPQIARIIKPHQIGGVRFLFDNIIESVERFSTSTGFGCILAHSMGLGKTLQINWVAEFNMWLPLDATNSPIAGQGEVRPRQFPIYVLNDSHKTLQMRAKVVKDWSTTGGVLMIGYELYRLLSMKKDKKPRKKRKDAKSEVDKEKEKEKEEKKPDVNEDTQSSDNTKMSEEFKADKEEPGTKLDAEIREEKKEDKKEDTPNDEEKKLLDEMYEALVRPGPDLVICDEGHRIKNSHSNISYALKQMRTKRRVVLTGYPLQNNLLEYWCMVDFVRPNYLGSKTEFCNMFERPIQNGQCIDSTPQDIRLMRYRAHVLHSLLVGFVQRRSHAVLQSTLPQKEEYVLLVRMTPLQRKLYDRFMNEVVRCTSVPNPLKAFAICCKIWNHPDVLYNFLKKRSEANAAIEEDLDLEELRGVTKAGRARANKAQPRRGAAKPRGAPKKPAATIPPNTTTGSGNSRQDPAYGNAPYPPNAQYGHSSNYPPYPNYQQPPGYYPPNQGYNQNYDPNYYQQQTSYGNNYPNQYPQNNSEWNQGYNQNNWSNTQGNYYGNSGYYNNSQYANGSPSQGPGPSQEYRGNPPAEYNSSQPFPPQYNAPANDTAYANNAMQPYSSTQNNFANQERPPYQGSYQNPPSYSEYNANATPAPSYPSNQPSQQYPNQSYAPPYDNNASYGPNPNPGTTFNNNPPASSSPYGSNPPTASTSYGPNPPPTNPPYGSTSQPPYNQYQNYPPNYPGYPNNMPPNQSPGDNMSAGQSNQQPLKTEPVDPNYPAIEIKSEPCATPNTAPPYSNSGYNYNQQNTSAYPNQPQSSGNINYPNQYPAGTYPSNIPPHLETKPPLDSAGSGSPVTAWPMTETLKTEVSKLKAEEKMEVKSESDGEVKIEDLDTKKIIKNKDDLKPEVSMTKLNEQKMEDVKDCMEKKCGNEYKTKSNESESEEEIPKRGRPRGRPPKDGKTKEKSKAKSKPKPRGRKDRKTSKDKNNDDKNDSDSEESEKEEKPNREEELALAKKAEEMTYDWATELLKDYVPGIIENSAKMELFFYILNESIKLGDRLLLFSQSLFTLNLIEDFLEKNYIPGTNCLWERNTNYYRLDGSTHALEREKLINEFNANPNIYLFLVSTRAGSLGINLVGANRVIVFDASWNPCHDTQAVCRVYRYGQKKACFVYRFVMDCCLEKKIYDRQINKQGMADRVVDECNPDAVLSMKEITNLCFDNDEKETEPKDLSEHKDRYIDVLMQGILTQHGTLLTKEPFQHESLLVDRKEKKLSSAEKRLAQRGYELEKKAASAPKPTTAYRTVRAADGSLVQRPVASVRPMQHGARWIPADVWRRQGMTAQEMTLPLDVVIPTNSAEKTNIVLKAGQRVMVLKSPKGIYMQLESGKIIAIKTSFKGLAGKGENKDSPVGKKVLGNRPSAANIPGSLKNNSAITITSKTAPRPGFQRVLTRPAMIGQNKMRPMLPGQKMSEIRNRLGEMRSYSSMRPRIHGPPGKLLRPNLPGSVSITKITKKTEDKNHAKRMDLEDDEPQLLDSDDEDASKNRPSNGQPNLIENYKDDSNSQETKSSMSTDISKNVNKQSIESAALVLTTDEKLPSEEALDNKSKEANSSDIPSRLRNKLQASNSDNATERHPYDNDIMSRVQTNEQDFGLRKQFLDNDPVQQSEKKINLLKNYRHQRPGARQPTESSLSQLERTTIALNKEGLPDFRKNLDDITQSYSPGPDEKPGAKSKKKKSPNKAETSESPNAMNQNDRPAPNPIMTHSVSSLLGSGSKMIDKSSSHNTAPVAPVGSSPVHRAMSTSMPHDLSAMSRPPGHMGLSKPQPMVPHVMGTPVPEIGKPLAPSASNTIPMNPLAPGQAYPAANPSLEAGYGQYTGYGMGYGAYPNAPSYYGGYGGAYYPPYGAPPAPASFPAAAPAPAPAPTPAPAPAPEGYLPPNPQW
ncbi:uncharacterized protein LOC113236525 isoform X3 [Hyposmocoma kahamanoa]|uniref:uncharacterized protein LOC113236525 isoform X3 n=1 Tax=Hyposmocoma kahamanoa TaxID=1477025 RepID=UPI000E6DA497|nr:uncharacterized protein LOC113236525 isoform X3 [Hyposmocoma kahamanoa]